MRTTSLLLVLALGAGLPASGCLSFSHDDYWAAAADLPKPAKEGWITSAGFRVEDFDVLWETAKGQACKGGWRIDDDATTYSKRRIVTAWKTDLSISRGTGKRRRRFIEFEEEKDVKNGWLIHVNTVVQKNVDIDDPLNPAAAKWREDEPDTEDAERVAYMVGAQFREFGPSKEFEQK